jgi:hypothetical protein
VTRIGVAALLLAFLSCRSAAAMPISQSEYAARLGKAAAFVDQAARRGGGGEPSAKEALKLVPERAEVTMPGTEAMAVDNRELLRTLRQHIDSGKDGMEAAGAMLRSLQNAVQPGPAASITGARDVLAGVLGRSEFQPSRLAKAQAWVMRLLSRALELLQQALERIASRLPSLHLGLSRAAQRAVLGILLAASVLITLYLVVRLVLRAAGARWHVEQARMPVSEPAKSHAQWLVEADAACGSGDYASAIRALHMAALMKLDSAGHVSYESSRTDGRFERALRARGMHEMAIVLGELNRLFAAVWYGLTPAGSEQYRQAHVQWARLEAMTSS